MFIQDFEKKWMSSFANGIDKKAIQKYVVSTGNYIWHIFSWKLLPQGSYLVGDAARKAYNNLSKQQRECALYIEVSIHKSYTTTITGVDNNGN